MMPIYALGAKFDVSDAVKELENPDVWNLHTMRTDNYTYVNKDVSDVWVRYRDFSEFDGTPDFFLGAHESAWYPEAKKLPAVVDLVFQVMTHVKATRLGGVLITKIPAGGQVAPHIDGGWHATYYQKYAVQLKGNKAQTFWFKDAQLSPETGDLYTFDNSFEHAVYNPTDEERMTLFVCARTS